MQFFSFFEEKIKNKFRNINFPKNTTLKEFFFKKNSDFSKKWGFFLKNLFNFLVVWEISWFVPPHIPDHSTGPQYRPTNPTVFPHKIAPIRIFSAFSLENIWKSRKYTGGGVFVVEYGGVRGAVLWGSTVGRYCGAVLFMKCLTALFSGVDKRLI